MPQEFNNIPAGTQVVTTVPIRSSKDSLAHPCGAVGIVTRTPAGQEKHYLIRFPDGFESSLLRTEFDVLKHFRDRMIEAHAASVGKDEEFNLDQFILYRCIAGSRAYGLETEDSDTDLRGVYLAPSELQWSLFGAPEQFEDSAGQWVAWELQKFLVMALKANPNVLECLYSPLVDKITPLGEQLIALRERFLSQLLFQTFNGYAMSQFKKIEQDRRVRGEVRWKHAMHLLRLLLSGAAALREKRLPVRVVAQRERLLAVKRGELAWEEVNEWRVELHGDFDRALLDTQLPQYPDYEAANRFLIHARHEQVKGAAAS